MKIDALRIGTLFSGIGAPEFALKALGIRHTIEYACDNDLWVKKTYLENHNPKIFYDDVTKINKPPLVDILIFGFPCQPFSLAGRRQGLEDVRGRLVLKALDVVKESKPRVFIAENVEGFIYQNDGKTLDMLLRMIKKMGYCVNYTTLNSLNFGIPQHRNRLWIVGSRGECQLPTGNIEYCSLTDLLDKKVSDNVFATKDFLAKPKVKRRLLTYCNDFINCITQTICRNGSSSEYIGYVAAVNKAIGQKRKPTVSECLRLFGFPDNFIFPESVCMTRRYAMLANSMVVPVVRAIIEGVL
jgi:DNA-cytosine methyltransferase